MKAVFVEQPGGPENLKYADQPKPEPGPGQALVKIAAAGVNFIDVYFRTGLYKADLPIIPVSNQQADTEFNGNVVTGYPTLNNPYALDAPIAPDYAWVTPRLSLVK